MVALRGVDKLAPGYPLAPGGVDVVNPEAVIVALIVEGELVRAPAVVGGDGAHQLLGLVDVAEAGQVRPCRVDGGGEDDYILPGQEGAPVLRFAAGDGIVGSQDRRDGMVDLRGQAQHDVVDQRGGIPVLRLLVGAGVEQAEAGLVEAGDGHYLHRPGAGGDLLHLRGGVDAEIVQVPGGLLDDLEGPGVVVVHGPEQQHHGVAILAQRPEEPGQGVVHVVQGRVGPHAGPVEQVPGYDGQVRPLLPGRLDDVVHAGQGIQAAQVLPVPGGTGQVPQVDVSGVQNSNHFPCPPLPRS